MTFADTSEVVWVQPNNVDSYPTNIFPHINLSSSPTAVLLIRENQRSYYQLLRKMICGAYWVFCQLVFNCGFNSRTRTEQLRVKTEQESKIERKNILRSITGLTSKILPSLNLDFPLLVRPPLYPTLLMLALGSFCFHLRIVDCNFIANFLSIT